MMRTRRRSKIPPSRGRNRSRYLHSKMMMKASALMEMTMRRMVTMLSISVRSTLVRRAMTLWVRTTMVKPRMLCLTQLMAPLKF